jgi:hypothetical protein
MTDPPRLPVNRRDRWTDFLSAKKVSEFTCQERELSDTIVEVLSKHEIILGSSVVERSTVNRLVAGSNPARGV